MHPDLSPHLHTSECNELINKLKECHETNKFGRFIGACNEVDALLNKCFRQERKDRQSENFRKSNEKREQQFERLSKTTE